MTDSAAEGPIETTPLSNPTGLEQRSTYPGMLPVAIVNSVLTILTMNVYIFWAKSRVRRYIWRTTFVNGSALEYTGRGRELYSRFAVCWVLVVALSIGLDIAITAVVETDSARFTMVLLASSYL